MIMISDGNNFGSKSFANQVLNEIRPSLIKKFGQDSEMMQDFDNEEKFLGLSPCKTYPKMTLILLPMKLLKLTLTKFLRLA